MTWWGWGNWRRLVRVLALTSLVVVLSGDYYRSRFFVRLVRPSSASLSQTSAKQSQCRSHRNRHHKTPRTQNQSSTLNPTCFHHSATSSSKASTRIKPSVSSLKIRYNAANQTTIYSFYREVRWLCTASKMSFSSCSATWQCISVEGPLARMSSSRMIHSIRRMPCYRRRRWTWAHNFKSKASIQHQRSAAAILCRLKMASTDHLLSLVQVLGRVKNWMSRLRALRVSVFPHWRCLTLSCLRRCKRLRSSLRIRFCSQCATWGSVMATKSWDCSASKSAQRKWLKSWSKSKRRHSSRLRWRRCVHNASSESKLHFRTKIYPRLL